MPMRDGALATRLRWTAVDVLRVVAWPSSLAASLRLDFAIPMGYWHGLLAAAVLVTVVQGATGWLWGPVRGEPRARLVRGGR